MNNYFKTLPGSLRIYITLAQFGSFVSMMALFDSQCYIFRCRGEIVDLRISFLVFSSVGFGLSILFLLLGKFNKLPPRFLIILTDFAWIISGIVLCVFSAVFESKYGDRFFINSGSLAVASAFGFVAVILYMIDVVYYLGFDYESVSTQ